MILRKGRTAGKMNEYHVASIWIHSTDKHNRLRTGNIIGWSDIQRYSWNFMRSRFEVSSKVFVPKKSSMLMYVNGSKWPKFEETIFFFENLGNEGRGTWKCWSWISHFRTVSPFLQTYANYTVDAVPLRIFPDFSREGRLLCGTRIAHEFCTLTHF